MTFKESASGFGVSVSWPKTTIEVDRSTGTISLVSGEKPVGVVHAGTGTCTDSSSAIQVASSSFPFRVTGKVTPSTISLNVRSQVIVHASSSDPACDDTVHETAEVLDPTLKSIAAAVSVGASAPSAHYTAGPVAVDLHRVS